VVQRESGPPEDDGPVAPPIPSFESLRAPRRRSAIDLLLPPPAAPVETPVEATAEESAGTPVQAPAQASAAPSSTAPSSTAPRPAEWGDLVAFGARVGTCAVRLVADGATRGFEGLRALLRG
jgi:hypothetical protein